MTLDLTAASSLEDALARVASLGGEAAH